MSVGIEMSCILHECLVILHSSSTTLTTLFACILFIKMWGNVVNTLAQPNSPAARELTCFKKLNEKHPFMLTSNFSGKAHAHFQNYAYVRNMLFPAH